MNIRPVVMKIVVVESTNIGWVSLNEYMLESFKSSHIDYTTKTYLL